MEPIIGTAFSSYLMGSGAEPIIGASATLCMRSGADNRSIVFRLPYEEWMMFIRAAIYHTSAGVESIT